MVGSVFKGLKAQQHQLGIKVPDVKSCVSLAPLATPELTSAMGSAIQARLLTLGWFALGQQHMLEKGPWQLDNKRLHNLQSVRLSASPVAPEKVALKLDTGSVSAYNRVHLVFAYDGCVKRSPAEAASN